MDLSDQDKEVMKLAAEQIYRKGCHTPQECSVANTFAQLVNRVLSPKPPEPKKD